MLLEQMPHENGSVLTHQTGRCAPYRALQMLRQKQAVVLEAKLVCVSYISIVGDWEGDLLHAFTHLQDLLSGSIGIQSQPGLKLLQGQWSDQKGVATVSFGSSGQSPRKTDSFHCVHAEHTAKKCCRLLKLYSSSTDLAQSMCYCQLDAIQGSPQYSVAALIALCKAHE